MNVKVRDLMTESVVTAEPHATVDRVRRILQRNKIGAIPIIDTEGQPLGIVSATDLVPSLKADSPVSRIMIRAPSYQGCYDMAGKRRTLAKPFVPSS